MIIKLSDYIMEQSVSDASVDDINLEAFYAEADVALSLANAYSKQLVMCEYASVYMEEDEGDKKTFGTKVKDFFGNIWKMIKDAWGAICRFFSGIWKKFIRWIKGEKIEPSKIAQKLQTLSAEEKKSFKIKVTPSLLEKISLVENIGNILDDLVEPITSVITDVNDTIISMKNNDKSSAKSKLTSACTEWNKTKRDREKFAQLMGAIGDKGHVEVGALKKAVGLEDPGEREATGYTSGTAYYNQNSNIPVMYVPGEAKRESATGRAGAFETVEMDFEQTIAMLSKVSDEKIRNITQLVEKISNEFDTVGKKLKEMPEMPSISITTEDRAKAALEDDNDDALDANDRTRLKLIIDKIKNFIQTVQSSTPTINALIDVIITSFKKIRDYKGTKAQQAEGGGTDLERAKSWAKKYLSKAERDGYTDEQLLGIFKNDTLRKQMES